MEKPEPFRGLPIAEFGFPGTSLRRQLVALVLEGKKTATAGLLVEYELEGCSVPAPGDREVVIDADDHYVGIIQTLECRSVRLADVDDSFARDEGEGFADAAEWRSAHERFWGGYVDQLRQRLGDPTFGLTDDTKVVCQRFRLVERFVDPIPAGESHEG